MITIGDRQFALLALRIRLLLIVALHVAFLKLKVVLSWLRWTPLRRADKSVRTQQKVIDRVIFLQLTIYLISAV